jgi:acyl carrier protein
LGALELLVELEAVAGHLDEAVLSRLSTVDDVEHLLAELGTADAGVGPVSVAAVVARVFGLDGPPPATVRPEEIPGWDSLGMLELVLAHEDSFGVSIDERLLSDVRTVGDLDALVR